MLDQIISGLKDKVGGELQEKAGLDQAGTDKAVAAAGSSLKDVLGGGDGLDIGDLTSLFSSGKNTSGADAIMSRLGTDYMGKLTGMGFSGDKANTISSLVLPALTKLLADKIGGNQNMLASLLGGSGSGAMGGLAEKVGGLGKLFGK